MTVPGKYYYPLPLMFENITHKIARFTRGGNVRFKNLPNLQEGGGVRITGI